MVRPLLLCAVALAACGTSNERPGATADTLVVFTAASLAAPMRATLDSFAIGRNVVVQHEHGASLELARRITALGRIPDVILLADPEVFPELLIPSATSWYAAFARNRMVVAFTGRSRHADLINAQNWHQLLLDPGVTIGRADPSIAPVGYRALLMYALAEDWYRAPGLARRLALRTPAKHLRANATELAALLSAGEIDYIVDYESLAKAQGFRYLTLPPQVDLSRAELAERYSRASVRVPQLRDTVTRRGAPILYGVSIPRAAPHKRVGEEFVAYLLGTRGHSLLRRAAIDMLDDPIMVGDSVPASIVQRP